MGEGAWVVGLIRTIHQLLKIIQKPVRTHTLRLWEGVGEQPQSWQRRTFGG